MHRYFHYCSRGHECSFCRGRFFCLLRWPFMSTCITSRVRFKKNVLNKTSFSLFSKWVFDFWELHFERCELLVSKYRNWVSVLISNIPVNLSVLKLQSLRSLLKHTKKAVYLTLPMVTTVYWTIFRGQRFLHCVLSFKVVLLKQISCQKQSSGTVLI